jgi:hypothetical protein
LAAAVVVVSVVVVSVAVVAQVLPQQEPAVLADLLLAVVGLVPLPHEPELPALAPPVVVHLVVEPEVPVHLRSRQSFSAAMARIFPSPEKPTYERVPRSR